jgi:hypothetical protein
VSLELTILVDLLALLLAHDVLISNVKISGMHDLLDVRLYCLPSSGSCIAVLLPL